MSYAYAALAGYQIVSGLQQAEMVKMQTGIQNQIDEFNAQQSEYDAYKVLAYGQQMIARQQVSEDAAAATAKVNAAVTGVKLDGSLGEVVAQNEYNNFLNQIDMENRVNEQALGLVKQARNTRLGIGMRNIQSSAQQGSIITGAVARGIGTAASGYIASNKPTMDLGYGEQSSTSTDYLTQGSDTQPSFRTRGNVLMMP